jgi:hypothetical protein
MTSFLPFSNQLINSNQIQYLECIFASYIYDKRKPCSKKRDLHFICDTHAQELLNLTVKTDYVQAAGNTNVEKMVSVHFTRINEDNNFLPFPFNYNRETKEFCIDKDKITAANENTSHNLGNILIALASNGTMNEFMTPLTIESDSQVAFKLTRYRHAYDESINTRYSKVKVYVDLTANESEMVELRKFPFFYKMLMAYMLYSSTIKEKPTIQPEESDSNNAAAQVNDEGVSFIPNLVVSVQDKYLKVINRNEKNIILVANDQTTYSSPIILAAQQTVSKIGLNSILKYTPADTKAFPIIC